MEHDPNPRGHLPSRVLFGFCAPSAQKPGRRMSSCPVPPEDAREGGTDTGLRPNRGTMPRLRGRCQAESPAESPAEHGGGEPGCAGANRGAELPDGTPVLIRTEQQGLTLPERRDLVQATAAAWEETTTIPERENPGGFARWNMTRIAGVSSPHAPPLAFVRPASKNQVVSEAFRLTLAGRLC